MKKILFVLFSLQLMQAAHSQHNLLRPGFPPRVRFAPVLLYDNANFTGEVKSLGVGQFSLDDFNDKASSLKVAPGYCAVLYENSDGGGGYGVYIDFLENQADLSRFSFENKASYINVFKAVQASGITWVRNKMVSGVFVAGHWERPRAHPLPPDPSLPDAVAGPSISPHGNSNATVMTTRGAITTITTLGIMDLSSVELWNNAQHDQQGIIGNDYRGIEEIGSAAFERASNSSFIPDNINFWYPQHQKNDHRSIIFFKRTLSGIVKEAHQSEISGTFQDYDVNVDITPSAKYNYLLTDAHPPEYTTIMSAEYNGTRILPLLEDEGQENCDDPASLAEFTHLEAEIAPEYWPQGNHTFGRSLLTDLALVRTGDSICVYGVWLYDKGHCCHPEIHPTEQLWWRKPLQKDTVKYYCNVICDASKRYLWRSQMDDGVKLKPWGEPPVKGLFAIAFEAPLPSQVIALGSVTKKYEVKNLEDYNVIEYIGANKVYNLMYQNKALVTFIPHNDAFKVSFENVGIAPGTNTVRGFLVIETSVGVTQQIASSITDYSNRIPVVYKLAWGSNPSQAPEALEKRFFKKLDGRYMFNIYQTSIINNAPVNQ